MTPEEEVRRAEEAQRVIENPIYKEAFALIEGRLVSQLTQIEISKERAEYLRTLLVANRKIRAYMENVMSSGQMASMDLEARKASKSFIEKTKEWMRG